MTTNSLRQWDPCLEEILEPIRRLPSPLVVIGVSGYGGSGKSTLAHALAERLSAPVISIDEFGTSAVFMRSDDWQGLDRERLARQVLAPLVSAFFGQITMEKI